MFVSYFADVMIVATVVMCVSYFLAVFLDFFSLVDVAWSYTFFFVSLLCAVFQFGFDTRMLFYVMMSIWSIRLGTHILVRLIRHYPQEDTRYVTLKLRWSRFIKMHFALFFAIQGVSAIILSLPLIEVASAPAKPFDVLFALSAALWGAAIFGEWLADRQLARFKSNPKNRGQVCNDGLWRYSRHPNYFFEWLIWCSFGAYAVHASGSLLALIAPIVMFVLLNFVSGVPYAEAQALKSKGALYVEYQRRTSRFFPWF